MFQSFNYRSKTKLKPFYHLVAAITAEEWRSDQWRNNGNHQISRSDPIQRTALPFTDLVQDGIGDTAGPRVERR